MHSQPLDLPYRGNFVYGLKPKRSPALREHNHGHATATKTVKVNVTKKPKPAPTKTVTVTARPKPGSAGGERRAGATRNCTPGYSPCPPALDYDCRGGSGNGPKYTGPVRVTGSDPYDLDRDGDEKACEWS
jgi:hypothetical protein